MVKERYAIGLPGKDGQCSCHFVPLGPLTRDSGPRLQPAGSLAFLFACIAFHISTMVTIALMTWRAERGRVEVSLFEPLTQSRSRMRILIAPAGGTHQARGLVIHE